MYIVRFLLIFTSISSLSFSADWSKDAALVKDMVVLDKAYIPALLMSRDGNVVHSKEAVDELVKSWAIFHTKWKDTVNKDWRKDFEGVDTLLQESVGLVADSQNINQAYPRIDLIRRILGGLRLKQDIPYFLDFVTATENALKDVVRITDRNRALTSSEFDIAEKSLLLAQECWNIVADTYFDKILYQIDIYYMGDLGSTRAEGGALFEDLTQNLRILDPSILSKKVERIEYTVRHFLEILSSTPGN